MSSTISQNSPSILTKRHFGWGITLLGLIAGIAFLVNGPLASFFASSMPVKERASASVANLLPVNVAKIEFVDSISQSRSYTGTIRARRRSDLGFELPGKIKTINVDEGDTVPAGAILAELDTDSLDAQRGATAARLAQANAVLDELIAGPRLEKINAAEAIMQAAQSEFDRAASNFERRSKAYSENAITDEEYDQARFAQITAQANLNSAMEQLSELKAGTRKEPLAGQRSVVVQLEAEAKEIEVAIEKSKLIAPFAGTVTRRYLDPGSIAQASLPVIKLVEQQHLEAWIGLPVPLVADLELGTRQDILIAGKTHVGITSAKIQELDPTTRTQTVLFELEPDASNQVVSGQLCEIQLSRSDDAAGYWIPTSALAKGIRGLWSVLIIVPDESGKHRYRVEKRDIEIIRTDSNRVLARGEIQSGDQIVVNGVHRISEGQLVVTADKQTVFHSSNGLPEH